MIDKPYCRQHYNECICSRCRYDIEDCCGRGQFSTYMCPFQRCSEYKPKEKADDSQRVPKRHLGTEAPDN